MGLYLTLACDVVIASSEAVFIESFVARGMVLHCGGAHLLVSRLGMQEQRSSFSAVDGSMLSTRGKSGVPEAAGAGLP